MFGTLQCKLPHKEPLTYIGNTATAAAPGPLRQDKPHASCQLCRKRKTRCNGNPSGCDKCIVAGAECQYSSSGSRRAKRAVSHEIETPRLKSRKGSTSHQSNSGAQGREYGKREGHGRGEGQGNAPGISDSSQQEQAQADNFDASMAVLEPESEPDFLDQQMGGYPRSPQLDQEMTYGNTKRRPGHPTVMDSFADLMMTEQLMDATDDNDMTEGATAASLLGYPGGLHNKAFMDSDDFHSITTYSSGLTGSDHQRRGIVTSQSTENSLSGLSVSSAGNINEAQKNLSSQAPDFRRWLSQPGHDSLNFTQTARQLDGWKANRPSESRTVASGVTAAAAAPTADSIGSDHTTSRCGCLRLTAGLLEELCAKGASSEPIAMDVMLGHLRKALIHCASTLKCEGCVSLSEHNMLLAMAGRYMSTLCERIVMSYIAVRSAQADKEQGQFPPSKSPSTTGTRTTPDGSVGSGRADVWETGSNLSAEMCAGSGNDEMWFSTYCIESGRERMQVLQCLVTIQLAELSRLLKKIKTRVGSRIGHLVPLIEAERRTRAIRLKLSSQHHCST